MFTPTTLPVSSSRKSPGERASTAARSAFPSVGVCGICAAATAGLDPQERVRLRNLLSALAQHSIIILSTHIVSDVELIAEKIILLREGQIAAFDTVSGLVGKSTLEDVYLTYFQKEA